MNNNSVNNLFLNQPVTAPVSSSPYLVKTTEVIINVNTSAVRTITLPTAVGNSGKFYVIKDVTGLAGTNNITINTSGGQTIDGASSLVIGTNYGSVQVFSDGTNYYSQALTRVPTTGTVLARASWSSFGNPIGMGTTVVSSSGQSWFALMASTARLDTTAFTQVFAQVGLTVTAQQVAIINPGLYSINVTITSSCDNTGGNFSVQIVKNGAIVASGFMTVTTNWAAIVNVPYVGNFINADTIDVRIGWGGNGGNLKFYTVNYSILQLPTSF
jgi:hypothetical protein